MKQAEQNHTARAPVLPAPPVYPRAGRDRAHARVIPVIRPGMSRAEIARRLV